jgi:hypothetical protein
MAAFLLAIVRGVHRHCTRPHDTREALPADHSSGQSAFSCHPHASCSGPWCFVHYESNERYGTKCKLCGQWRRTVLAVKSEEPKMKRLSKLRHFINCLHKTGLHLQPWLWERTVWWSISDTEDVTSSPVCQRTAWHWCYTGPVDGARLKRRGCGAGGGVGGAQRSVRLLQSTATRRCCRLVCPRLLIQYICSYPPYRRPFLYPQPKDPPCRGDRDPLTQIK